MTLPDVLLYLFIVVVAVQAIYYLLVFGKFLLVKSTSAKPGQNEVSIIVCAKNEAEALKSNLPLIVNQEYPRFEVILVNDGSTDSTLDIMQIYANKYHNVRVVNVEQNETFWGNKKYALTLGIKAANYDRLLLTDADCKPLSRYWVTQMNHGFDKDKSIVLGYGAYEKTRFSFLNKLIRFETLLTAIQYLSYANIGLPYMGVGRNLAYKKALFFDNNGFVDHMDVRSGDDDLFINQVATKANVAVNISPHSFTKSAPETTFKEWFRQKKRHISTSFKYKPVHIVLLSSFYISQVLFWVLPLALLVYQHKLMETGVLFAGTVLLKTIVLAIAAKRFREKDLILFLPVLELFLICFQFSIFISNLFSKQSRWK